MKQLLLKDVCDFANGKAHEQFVDDNGDYILITSKFIASDGVSFRRTNERLTPLNVGDLCMVMSDVPRGRALAKCFLVDKDNTYTLNQRIGVFRADNRFLKKYFYYQMNRNKYFLSFDDGDSQTNLRKDDILKCPIICPSKEEQQKIINILDCISLIIEKRKKQIRDLEELIKARFVELFGDENNSKGWNIVNIEDVADVQVGVVIKPAQYYTDEDNGIKAFRSLNIGTGYIKDNDWVYFSPEGHQKNSKSILKEDDLLVVRSGAPGTACVVPKEYEGCNAIDIIIAHPNIGKVNPHYLCAFTNMPHGKKQIEEGTGGAAQQHFNVGKYNKMKLMLPPMNKQLEYVDFVKQVDKSKVVIQKALDETKKMYDCMMQKYFG